MIQVKRKDSKESLEGLLRRFSRKVQQSGVLAVTKQSQHFEKPPTKPERRKKAIQRKERKAQKFQKARFERR